MKLDGRPITTTTPNPLQALLALRAAQAGSGSGGGRLNALALLRGRGGSGGGGPVAGNNLSGGEGPSQNQGTGTESDINDSNAAGMLIIAAMMGAEMASASSQAANSQPTSSGGKSNIIFRQLFCFCFWIAILILMFYVSYNQSDPIHMINTGTRPTLPAAVCANPEIIRNLFRQNPERVRMLARTFGFGELPESLTAENLDISTFCGNSS